MRHTTTRPTVRLAAVLTAVLAVATVTACGRNAERATTDATAKPGSGASTTTTSPPTSAPPSSAPGSTTASTPKGTVAPSTAAYPSAVTGEVVDNPQFDKVESSTKARVAKAGLPGASLLVMQHGELVEQEAWSGYTLDTVVPIASASKWLSAATIMTLVDEGKIDLDAPISTYLDYAKGEFGTITTRQLMSLTSGVPDDENIPCYSDPTISLQDCNRQIATMPLVNKPGEAFRYGGQHLHVAAGVAEAVSGQGWSDLFAQRIAGPLGMTHTGFLGAAFDGANVQHPLPAGSGRSTLGDYGRFLEMIAHDGVAPSGQRILSHDAITQMQSIQMGGAAYKKAASFRMDLQTPYGLGEWLDWVGPDGSSIVVSSDGAFGFRPWIDKQNDIVGVYMVDDHLADQAFSDGDPRNESQQGKVSVSGNYVFTDVAEALGASLPKDRDQRPGH